MTAGHLTARGTHQGEFLGIAPTGREVTWTETHVGRYENGKLVEHWGNSDDLGLMQQMDAVPEMGEQRGAEPLTTVADFTPNRAGVLRALGLFDALRPGPKH